jgi:hypothetical protein
MRYQQLLGALLLAALAAGCASSLRHQAVVRPPEPALKSNTPAMFFPPPISDEWTKWIVGDWEGSARSDSGKGTATVHIEEALSGQFLMIRMSARISALDPDYLKKHMKASDEEIQRFQRSGYEALEIYTIDQKTGEVIGFLFDNLRCIATGRGKREGFKETIAWEWHSGHKSTRITERVSDNKLLGIERTRNADGSIMEDRVEMTRVTPRRISTNPE